MRRVLLLEWLRLREVKIRACNEPQEFMARAVMWPGVRFMLMKMGFKEVVGTGRAKRIRGRLPMPRARKDLEVVMAGVSFLATQDSSGMWQKQNAFADGQEYRSTESNGYW